MSKIKYIILLLMFFFISGCNNQSGVYNNRLQIDFLHIETPSIDKDYNNPVYLCIFFDINLINKSNSVFIIDLEGIRNNHAYLTIIGKDNTGIVKLMQHGYSENFSINNIFFHHFLHTPSSQKSIAVPADEKITFRFSSSFPRLYSNLPRIEPYTIDMRYNLIMTINNWLESSVVIASIYLNGKYISIERGSEIDICFPL